MLSILVLLLISVTCIRAFDIIEPDSNGWQKNVWPVRVCWIASPQDPPVFSMVLRHVKPGSVVDPVNPLTIATNIQSSWGFYQVRLPPISPSESYQLLFVDANHTNWVLANSTVFPIISAPVLSIETVTQRTFTVLPTPLMTIWPTTTQTATFVSQSTPISTTLGTSTATATTTLLTLTTPATTTPRTTTPPAPNTTSRDGMFVPINAAGTRAWDGRLLFVGVAISLALSAL